MTFPDFIERVDWSALKKQKEWLIKQKAPEADGLVGMLDAFMDMVTDECGLDVNKVFPGLEDKEHA